jgi:hypothetical protein
VNHDFDLQLCLPFEYLTLPPGQKQKGGPGPAPTIFVCSGGLRPPIGAHRAPLQRDCQSQIANRQSSMN